MKIDVMENISNIFLIPSDMFSCRYKNINYLFDIIKCTQVSFLMFTVLASLYMVILIIKIFLDKKIKNLNFKTIIESFFNHKDIYKSILEIFKKELIKYDKKFS